ncbi:hypothetical protein Leryth_025734 [Lithospermum erythrorhizon]|nr:hypothetical protein Leryth_025734 [Lithospermum erythrorhizon]
MNPQTQSAKAKNISTNAVKNLNRLIDNAGAKLFREIARQVQQEQQISRRQMEGQQQEGRYRGGQQQRIQQQVRQLPQICRVQVPQQCQQGY